MELYRREFPPSLQTSNARSSLEPEKHSTTFVTFGGGSKRYRQSAVKLANEASQTGWFKKIILQLDHAPDAAAVHPLVSIGLPVWSEAQETFIRSARRGFGYWIWKPILLLQVMASLPDGAIIFYADGGCELSMRGRARFLAYVAMTIENGALFFTLPFAEVNYTKNELALRLDASQSCLAGPQVQATSFLLCNSPQTRELVQSWLNLCSENEFSFLTDACDLEKQDPLFREHRHDQSILSLLVKQGGYATIPWEDNYDKTLYRIWNSWVFLFPLHARRAQKIRLVWRLSKLSSQDGCAASLSGSFLFRAQQSFHKATRILKRLRR